MRLDIGACTDVGCVRELNEDSFRTVPEFNLFVLSDGVGGEAHGEVASAMAVDVVVAHIQKALEQQSLALEGEIRPDLSDRSNRLASAVRCANRAIREATINDESLRGMGATIVMVWLDEKGLSLAHVGDSRAYRLRSNVLERLTRDHSLVAEHVRLGMLTEEQAETSPMQTVLIRALGASDDVQVDLDEHALLDGDFVMLCSDGLSRMVADSAIAHTLSKSTSAQSAADQLVQLAKDGGGTDNITVVVVRVNVGARGLLDRLRLSFQRFSQGP